MANKVKVRRLWIKDSLIEASVMDIPRHLPILPFYHSSLSILLIIPFTSQFTLSVSYSDFTPLKETG